MATTKLLITHIEEKKLDSGKSLYKCTTASGDVYTAWDSKIKEYLDKPTDFETYEKQHGEFTNKFIKLPSQGGGGFQKRPFTPSFKDSKEAAILSAKSMTLAFAKDLGVALANKQGFEVVKFVKEAYLELIPLLGLDDLSKTSDFGSSATTGVNTATQPAATKNLNTMLTEISRICDMKSFATWWNENQESIKALTPQNRQILFSAKSHKSSEIENQEVEEIGSDSIPF